MNLNHGQFCRDGDVCILDEVEDSDPVADGREQMSAVRAEQEVALAVDCSKQVGELEVCLHGRLWSISKPREIQISTLQQSANRQSGISPVLAAKNSRTVWELFSGAGEFFLLSPDVHQAPSRSGLGEGTLDPRPFGLGTGESGKGEHDPPNLKRLPCRRCSVHDSSRSQWPGSCLEI